MNLDYSDFLGRIAIGRVFNGTLQRGADVGIAKLAGTIQPTRITKLYTFRGLERDEAEEVSAAISSPIAGVEGIQIGESITDPANPAPLEPLRDRRADAGHDFHGEHQPLRRPRRPMGHFARSARAPAKELLTNVSLRVEDTGHHRRVSRAGARRIAARDSDRNHAPRRLRADGRQAGNRGARRKTARNSSRSSCWSSIARKLSSAS